MRSSRQAFSLLELMIAVTIMSLLLYSTALSLRTGADVSEDMLGDTILTANAARVLHELAMEIRSADTANYVPKESTDPNLMLLSYSPCTGFDSLGQPEYSGSLVMIEYDKAAGTLTRVVSEGGVERQELLAQFVAPLEGATMGFDADYTDSESSNLVYGKRLELTLTLCRDQTDFEAIQRGQDATASAAEIELAQEAMSRTSQASRLIFLRSFIFGKDSEDVTGESETAGTGTTSTSTTGGGTGNTSTTTTTTGDVIESTGTNTQHVAVDDSPDPIVENTEAGANPPIIIYGSPAVIGLPDAEPVTKEVRITVKGATDASTGVTLPVSLASIKSYLPERNEEYYTISIDDDSNTNNGVKDSANVYYIDIKGPWIGSMIITTTAGSPDLTGKVKGQTYTVSGGSVTLSNTL